MTSTALGSDVARFNLQAAWIGVLLGFLSGVVQGLFFHQQQWLGGYGSWTRRMMRLGHISFFGVAFINLLFAFTLMQIDHRDGWLWPARLIIAAAAGMPLFCYLSAFHEGFRHGFILPVGCLTTAAVMVIQRIF